MGPFSAPSTVTTVETFLGPFSSPSTVSTEQQTVWWAKRPGGWIPCEMQTIT